MSLTNPEKGNLAPVARSHPDSTGFLYIAAGVSALGGLLLGYDTGVISGAILFVQKEFGLTATREEVVVSAALLGAIIGTAIGGRVADRLGRRKVLTLVTAGVGLINVLMTVVAMRLVDRVGRRPLLLTGLVGMVLGLSVLGLAFFSSSLSKVVGRVAVGSMMLYVSSFAIALGPVFRLLSSEIYPLKIRGLAMSMATLTNWGANLLVALTFLTLVQVFGRPATFWSYALVGIGGWLFAYFLVPETKGRSLEEIEAHWRAGKHPRRMGSSSTQEERPGGSR